MITLPEPAVCEREILRYAGCPSPRPDVLSLMRECLEASRPVITYRIVYRRLPVSVREPLVDLGVLEASSKGLSRNLEGCREAVLFAATIGAGFDRLLARYSRLSPARAALLQAIGAERVESLCDAFGCFLSAQTGQPLRPRFSPGYGDLPLALQRDICQVLDCAKWLGICLNESLLMSPSKSVTAIYGLGGAPRAQSRGKCLSCPKTDCEFRRES